MEELVKINGIIPDEIKVIYQPLLDSNTYSFLNGKINIPSTTKISIWTVKSDGPIFDKFKKDFEQSKAFLDQFSNVVDNVMFVGVFKKKDVESFEGALIQTHLIDLPSKEIREISDNERSNSRSLLKMKDGTYGVDFLRQFYFGQQEAELEIIKNISSILNSAESELSSIINDFKTTKKEWYQITENYPEFKI